MLTANLGLLLTMIGWGSMIPLLNLLFERWDPWFLAAVRYGAAAPLLLLLLVLTERRRPPAQVAAWRIWLLGAIGIGAFAPLYTLGVAHAHPVTAAIISAAGPAVAALVARLGFGLPLDRRMGPAILLAFAGATLATYDPARAGGPFDLRGGEALLLLASACWAWYSLAAQRWLKGCSQLRITGLTVAPGAVVILLAYAAARLAGAADALPPLPRGAADQAMFAWMILVPVVAGTLLWNFGVRTLGLVVAALFLNLIPIAAVAITAAIGIAPSLNQLLGGALVLAGVIQAQLRQMLARRAAAAGPPRREAG